MQKKYIAIFLFIIFNILILYLINTYHFDIHQPLCKDLYINKLNKQYTILNNLLDKNFCSQIINESESIAKTKGWSSDRHKFYPTVDNEITPEWKISIPFTNIIANKLYPQIEKIFNVQSSELYLREIFVVKYDMKGQKNLEYHTDGSEFSFVIALNDDFKGGGTTFKHSQKNINLNIGDCLLFSGQNEHKGNEITSGTRYILTGFINYKQPDFCENIVNNYYYKKLGLFFTDIIFIISYILFHFEII